LASGGGDKTARLYDLQSGQSQQIAQHDAPIKSMRWVDTAGQPILATGGWDKMLKVCIIDTNVYLLYSVQI
jgi:mRNA export factor